MEKKLANIKVKLVLLLSLTIVSILLAILMNINIFGREIKTTGSNYIFALIAVITCYTYYYIYNKDEFFIITLVYISFAVEYFFETILMTRLEDKSGILGLLIFTSIYRLIFIILITKGNNKLTRWLNKRKALSLAMIIIMTITLMFLEIYFKSRVGYIEKIYISIILNIIVAVYYIVITTKLAIKMIKESDFIWSVIIASINMFIFKKIYLIISIKNLNPNVYEWRELFIFCGFFILVIGLFIEIVIRVKENEGLKEDLEVFYNLTEKDPINNVIIYDEKDKIMYANKITRENEYIDNISLIKGNKYDKLNNENNSYKSIKKLSNNIDIETSNKIHEKFNKDGNFNDVIFLKDGTIIRLDIKQVESKKNKVRNVISFRDITRDYNNNREMKINENKFVTITENIKDIICTMDIHGKITYVNTMAKKLVGYTNEELLGKKYTMLLDSNEEKAYNFIKSNYKESAFMKHNVICKDKSVVVMESVVSRICTENNELVGHVVVSRDISFRETLEHLKLKYKEMKAYDKVRGEFFANISHELRTPINIIFSCFQLLNNKKENGDKELAIYYNKYENTIRQNCFRLLRLVNNLIDITKIDSGYIKMRFGNYNIINLVEDITLSVIPYVEAKKINIMFDTEVEELEIKCDPDEIERVMLNLISNAIKFNKIGGNIFVNIAVNEKWVEISVKDTGIGIEEELRGYVFERFAQHDKSLNRVNEGSGIGLALVRSLVELHNGEVHLNKNEDEGSEFIVKLPNVISENIDENTKNISGNNTKPIAEKICIELSDIYDLL